MMIDLDTMQPEEMRLMLKEISEILGTFYGENTIDIQIDQIGILFFKDEFPMLNNLN